MPKLLGNGSAWKTHPQEYDAYNKARKRCNGQSHARDTKNYLERGIEFRFATFWDFFDCVGARPAGHTLDRIDVDGHYEPGNVRWADPVKQARNRTNNRLVTYQGKSQTLADWCEELDLNYARTYARLYKLNLSVSESFSLASRYGQRF
jgi:hypothetical protein